MKPMNAGWCISALMMMLLGACARPDRQKVDTLTTGSAAAGTTPIRFQPGDFVIDSGGFGRLRLGITLDSARRILPKATFTRESDGEGAILVGVEFGKDTIVALYADESDPEHIDWTKRIERIETFSAAFHASSGVRVAAPVADVEKILGSVTEIILSEIESRQYVTFANQPSWISFRLDYTGKFERDSRRTTAFAPNAKIFSIAVSK